MAPVIVPGSALPYEQSTRLSFIQHNLLEGLPFDDDRFDLVHCSQLALSGPGERFRRSTFLELSLNLFYTL